MNNSKEKLTFRTRGVLTCTGLWLCVTHLLKISDVNNLSGQNMYHQLIGRKSKELLTHIKNGVLVTSRWLSFNGCARRIQIGHPFFGQSDILERKNTLLIIWYITCLKQGDNSRSNRRLLAILFCRFVGEPWCSFSPALFPTWMVGQMRTDGRGLQLHFPTFKRLDNLELMRNSLN